MLIMTMITILSVCFAHPHSTILLAVSNMNRQTCHILSIIVSTYLEKYTHEELIQMFMSHVEHDMMIEYVQSLVWNVRGGCFF